MIYKTFVRPFLFQMEAEQAHERAVSVAVRTSHSRFLQMVGSGLYNYQSSSLERNLWGLHFRNPVGLAAGFDKNGLFPEVMEHLGFGFVEAGSITADPSTGNPRPRAFRLPQDHSLINRMGLNNDGAKTIVKRLKNRSINIPLGINVAKTHDPAIVGDRAIMDYRFSFLEALKVADYVTLNISCPNTADGKTFEDPGALDELLTALNIKSDARIVPTLVKFSVDLERAELEKLVEVCENHLVHGYVATNTSSKRDGLLTEAETVKRIGSGGLSGRAIARKSTMIIRWIYELLKGQKPIIGVGGIDSAEAAVEKIKAGADLLQVYTGLIYEGPGLVRKINKGLVRYMKRHGIDSIYQISGKGD